MAHRDGVETNLLCLTDGQAAHHRGDAADAAELGRMRRMKEAAAATGRDVLIAVAGCVAQAEGEEIVRRAPTVDLVVGSQNYHRLPELVARWGSSPAGAHRLPRRCRWPARARQIEASGADNLAE